MSPSEGEKDGRRATVRAGVALVLTASVALVLMVVLGARAYDWIKAVHVMAIIAWMAGMLYLPRLFVYHTDARVGSELSETLKIMERRLLRIIINPAMVLAWVVGLWLAWSGGWFKAPWFHGKLLFVIGLSAVHGHLAKSVRLFAADKNVRSSRHWRILNEVPALLMVVIVILVIVKPF
ncbi:MAG: protoporphyrinogen oxidase HemJ [Hyphomicrobiaceae bacterium]|nr:protoporphyrinogen oxidase HemJ [Hyphomicrobiaceae bacterium]